MTDALALFDTAPALRTDGGRGRCPACSTLTAATDLAPATTYDGPRVCRRCAALGAQAQSLALDTHELPTSCPDSGAALEPDGDDRHACPDAPTDPWTATDAAGHPERVSYTLTFQALADLGHADPREHLTNDPNDIHGPSWVEPCTYCRRRTLARFYIPQPTTRAAWLPVCPPCSHDIEHRTGRTLF